MPQSKNTHIISFSKIRRESVNDSFGVQLIIDFVAVYNKKEGKQFKGHIMSYYLYTSYE
jgi:hypothetical protein